jgi:hypothetical protein
MFLTATIVGRTLSYVTGGTGDRAMGLAYPLGLSMALDTLLIHHFFGFDGPFILERFDCIGFLGEDAMTDVAIFQGRLVFGVRKRHFPPFAPVDVDPVRPLAGGICCSQGQHEAHH